MFRSEKVPPAMKKKATKEALDDCELALALLKECLMEGLSLFNLEGENGEIDLGKYEDWQRRTCEYLNISKSALFY